MKRMITRPFEDDYIAENLSRHLMVLLRSTGRKGKGLTDAEKLKYVIIDPVNGVSYELPYGERDVHEIVADHRAKYDPQGLLPDNYVGPQQGVYRFRKVPRQYCYEPRITKEGALVYHMYLYEPIPINKVQGLYEICRLVFFKDKAWEESRTGVRELTPGMIFGKNSIIRKAVPLYSPELRYEDGTTAITYRGGQKPDINKVIKIDRYESIQARSCALFDTDLVPLFVMCSFHMKRNTRGHHYFKDVPEDIKAFLDRHNVDFTRHMIDEPALKKYLVHFNVHSETLSVCGKKKLWFFTYNFMSEAWSSTGSKRIINAHLRSNSVDTMSNRTPDADYYNGTMYEDLYRKVYDTEYNAGQGDIFSLRNMSILSTWLSAEQALKMGRADLLYAIVNYAKHLANAEDEKLPLPQLLSLTGPQLKLIPRLSNMASYQVGNLVWYLREIKDCALPVELQIKIAISGQSSICKAILSEFNKQDKSPIDFFKAIFRYDTEKAELLIGLCADYIGTLNSYLVQRFLQDHPDVQYPLIPKPSRIKELHDYISNLYAELREQDMQRRREVYAMEMAQCNEKIIEQKQRDKKMEYEDDDFCLILPESSDDIISEGATLHHCVGTYVKEVAAGNTHILFFRRKKEPDKRFFTMEVRDRSIRQFYGKHDSFNRDKKIKAFVEKYAATKNFRIDCKVG